MGVSLRKWSRPSLKWSPWWPKGPSIPPTSEWFVSPNHPGGRGKAPSIILGGSLVSPDVVMPTPTESVDPVVADWTEFVRISEFVRSHSIELNVIVKFFWVRVHL